MTSVAGSVGAIEGRSGRRNRNNLMRAEFALIREWPILLVGAAIICAALVLAVASLASERRRVTVAGGEPDQPVPAVPQPPPPAPSAPPSPPTCLVHAEGQLPPLTLADSALAVPDTHWGDDTQEMAGRPESGAAGSPALTRAGWAGETPRMAAPPMSAAVWADDPRSAVAPDMGSGPEAPGAWPGTGAAVSAAACAAAW